MNRSEGPGLYVHVPFCRTKCPYCDFYSETSAPVTVAAWLDAVRKEAELYRGRFEAFDTVYLGGGTPSLLDAGQIAELLGSLRQCFSFLPDIEATIEVNPDDITAEKPDQLREAGFNRISIGAQSFDEGELRFLRRRHTAAQTKRAIEWARSAGFTNLGIDLIYGFHRGLQGGLQGQTEASWMKSLECALSFRPEHLSCYQMTIEDATPFGKMKAEGRLQSLGEEAERNFFLLTSRTLKSRGYTHYEISNFAVDEAHRSRHNQKYWRHVPYLGLGPAAHSFQGGVRWWNHRSIDAYCDALSRGDAPVGGSETLTEEQLQLEALYFGFRTRDGFDVELVRSTPGWAKIVSQLENSGLATLKDGRVMPTREGFLVADSLPLLFSN
jgi:oxygen-independent coproporphyrinogen-3 oxidase